MGLVEGGKITLKEAGKKIGVSYRQAKRIRRALRVKGVKGMIHGNTGRAPWNLTADSLRQRVLQLSKQLYEDFNDVHLTEKLSEEHQIELSRETVRKLRRAQGRDRAEASPSSTQTPQTSGAKGSRRGDGALGRESPPLVGSESSSLLSDGRHG